MNTPPPANAKCVEPFRKDPTHSLLLQFSAIDQTF